MSKLQAGFSGAHGFSLEPDRKTWNKKGVKPQTWVCEDCGQVIFFIAPHEKDNIFRFTK
ncbi:MAG TPA: hypothetical protein VMX18_00530 [Candidatus Bipolaricaulota bacterium]|nr:hypothetical protein [Candidatus Bipolaricaulota bacterium]